MKNTPSHGQSRHERLASLKAQRTALSNATGYRPLSDPAWPRLSHEISSLEESFVPYQGRELDAEVVNEIDGSLVIRPDLHHEGHDRLFRTAEGVYYLHRELNMLDVDGDTERRASGRTLVHRVSTAAAALWATMRCCARTDNLRSDTARLLASPPVRLTSDAATVSLTLPLDLYRQVLAMGAYDGRSGFGDTVRHCLESKVAMWLECLDQDPTPAEFLAQYENALDAGEHPGHYPVNYRCLPAADRPDLALCAAGAVEPLGDDEPGSEADDLLPDDDQTPWGEPAAPTESRPLAPVLVALAAQWQAQAEQARAQQRDLAPVLTSGKLQAQADLLEGCAAALLTALDGKEGK